MADQSRNLPALSDGSLKADAHRFAEPDNNWVHCPDGYEISEGGYGFLRIWVNLRLAEIIFRRCPACGERNIVKDDSFTCGSCGADLPADWNFECPT